MFLFYVLNFFRKGDTIQGGTLFKRGYYLRKYGNPIYPHALEQSHRHILDKVPKWHVRSTSNKDFVPKFFHGVVEKYRIGNLSECAGMAVPF